MARKCPKRVALANRVLALFAGSRIPISFVELAKLRNLAETQEERNLPLAEIATNVLRRESAKEKKVQQ
jgi:hypothetical protein